MVEAAISFSFDVLLFMLFLIPNPKRAYPLALKQVDFALDLFVIVLAFEDP
jgi:hypothetical protein